MTPPSASPSTVDRTGTAGGDPRDRLLLWLSTGFGLFFALLAAWWRLGTDAAGRAPILVAGLAAFACIASAVGLGSRDGWRLTAILAVGAALLVYFRNYGWAGDPAGERRLQAAMLVAGLLCAWVGSLAGARSLARRSIAFAAGSLLLAGLAAELAMERPQGSAADPPASIHWSSATLVRHPLIGAVFTPGSLPRSYLPADAGAGLEMTAAFGAIDVRDLVAAPSARVDARSERGPFGRPNLSLLVRPGETNPGGSESGQGEPPRAYLKGVRVDSAQDYEVRLRARSTPGGELSFHLVASTPPFENRGLLATRDLSEEWSNERVRFRAKETDDDATLLLFLPDGRTEMASLELVPIDANQPTGSMNDWIPIKESPPRARVIGLETPLGAIRLQLLTDAEGRAPVHVTQNLGAIDEGRKYAFRVRARSDQPRNLEVGLESRERPWNALSRRASIEVGPEWRDVVQFLEATEPGPTPRWFIDVSGPPGWLELADASFRAEEADREAVSKGNPWRWRVEPGVEAKAVLGSHSASITLEKASSRRDPYDARLCMPLPAMAPCRPGERHVVSFRAWSDRARTVFASILVDPSRAAVRSAFRVGPAARSLVLEFAADRPLDAPIFCVAVGDRVGKLEFDLPLHASVARGRDVDPGSPFLEYEINGLGFRGPAPLVPKPAGVRRVLLVGSTPLFGIGIHEEDLLGSQLQARMNSAAKPKVEIVSLAMIGMNAEEATLLARGLAGPLGADVVLAFVEPRAGQSRFDRIRESILAQPDEPKSIFRLPRFLEAGRFLSPPDDAPAARAIERWAADPARSDVAIGLIAWRGKSAGAWLDDRWRTFLDGLSKLARADHRTGFLDLGDGWGQGASAEGVELGPSVPLPSASAHAAAAERIAPFLKDLLDVAARGGGSDGK